MTPHLDPVALLPEIITTGTFAVVLVADLFVDGRRRLLSLLSIAGIAAALGSVVGLGVAGHHASLVGGSYVVDHFSLLSKGIFLSCGLAVLMLGLPDSWQGEYVELVVGSLLGMVMIASARDLLTFFIAFELLAVPGYLLAGWQKRTREGPEAALKYYLLGVLATAVMLYGLSLLFGIAGGSTAFSSVAKALDSGHALVSGHALSSGSLVSGHSQTMLAQVAVLFVLVGMGFKISAVPFHFWAPDAYQGAPIPVAAFLSIASKSAGFVALMILIDRVFPGVDAVWSPFLWCLAALTMTVGNLAALRQTDMVRLLAYSSIAQAGYLLIPLAVSGRYRGSSPEPATFTYLMIYAAMNVGAFAVVVAVKHMKGSTAISSFKGLLVEAPALGGAFTVFLLSLAGLPPFGGWFAKFVVFRTAISADSAPAVALAVVAAANTAIGLVYYASVIRQLWTVEIDKIEIDGRERIGYTADGNIQVPVTVLIVVALAAVVVMITGVFPSVVTHLGGFSSLAQ